MIGRILLFCLCVYTCACISILMQCTPQTPQGCRVQGTFVATNFSIYFVPDPAQLPTTLKHLSPAFFTVPLAAIAKCVLAQARCLWLWNVVLTCGANLSGSTRLRPAASALLRPAWDVKPSGHPKSVAMAPCWWSPPETAGCCGLDSLASSTALWCVSSPSSRSPTRSTSCSRSTTGKVCSVALSSRVPALCRCSLGRSLLRDVHMLCCGRLGLVAGHNG